MFKLLKKIYQNGKSHKLQLIMCIKSDITQWSNTILKDLKKNKFFPPEFYWSLSLLPCAVKHRICKIDLNYCCSPSIAAKNKTKYYDILRVSEPKWFNAISHQLQLRRFTCPRHSKQKLE